MCRSKGFYYQVVRWVLICGLLLPFLLPNQRVYACQCPLPELPQVALQKATAVFSGKVTDVMISQHLGFSSRYPLIHRNQSGEMTIFEEDFANDKTRLRRLLGSQPRREANYERHTPDDLEKLLVSVHAFQVQVADLRGKYQHLFEADEDRRKEIRAEHRP